MDFAQDAATVAFREEVRRFVDEHLPPELEEELYRTGDAHHQGFGLAMGERGWIVPQWDHGGRETLSPAEAHVLTEELVRVHAPTYAVETAGMVAKVIAAVGPEAMRNEIVPKVLTGEVTIALGMSEPEAGSDVAAVRTRARAVDGGWVIDGQKMFTTNGHLTDHVFVIARTDPDSERHRGLTTFLVPLDREGIEVQAVYTVSGERTNITFYEDVFVEDEWRISEPGDGWRSLMLALQDEHSAAFSAHLGRQLEEAERWAGRPDHDGRAPIEREDVRRRLTRAATDLEVARLLEMRTIWMESQGEVPVAEGPMSKLFGTEAIVRHAEELSAMVGPDALRSRGEPSAVEGGRIEHALRFSLGTTIYAGSSEIQRNIIAQRRCGLPRD